MFLDATIPKATYGIVCKLQLQMNLYLFNTKCCGFTRIIANDHIIEIVNKHLKNIPQLSLI